MYLSKFGYLFIHIWRYFSLEFFLVYVRFSSMVAKFISIFYKQYYFASILLYVVFFFKCTFIFFFLSLCFLPYALLFLYFKLWGNLENTFTHLFNILFIICSVIASVCVYICICVWMCIYNEAYIKMTKTTFSHWFLSCFL